MFRIVSLIACALTAISAESSEFYVELALKHNSEISAARSLSAAALSDYQKESTFKENPELMVGLMSVPVSTFPALNRDTMSNFSVGITQALALPWESHYRKSAAKAGAEKSAVELSIQKAVLVYAVREKLNEIQFREARAKNLLDAKKLITATLKALAVPRKDARNVAGQILEAQASLASSENDITQNNFELEKAWLELEALCGQKLARDGAASLTAHWAHIEFIHRTPGVYDIKQTLIYKKAAIEVEREQAMLSLSRSTLFPEVKLSASYMVRRPVPGMGVPEDMVSISASTPLPFFYPLKDRHAIDAQEHRLKAAEAMLEESGRKLNLEIAVEEAKIKALTASIENFSKHILPAHASAHRSHLTNVNLAGGSAAEALIAYRMYISAGEERLKELREVHSALNRFEYLTTQGDTP